MSCVCAGMHVYMYVCTHIHCKSLPIPRYLFVTRHNCVYMHAYIRMYTCIVSPSRSHNICLWQEITVYTCMHTCICAYVCTNMYCKYLPIPRFLFDIWHFCMYACIYKYIQTYMHVPPDPALSVLDMTLLVPPPLELTIEVCIWLGVPPELPAVLTCVCVCVYVCMYICMHMAWRPP